MKSKVVSVTEFETLINKHIKIKDIFNTPHRYIIRFGLSELSSDKNIYKLEILRYKKLNIPVTQKLSNSQLLHYLYKEEKTEDERIKKLNITMGENIKGYKSVLIKSSSDGNYYFKGIALSCIFKFSPEELTVDNAKKIAKSIILNK